MNGAVFLRMILTFRLFGIFCGVQPVADSLPGIVRAAGGVRALQEIGVGHFLAPEVPRPAGEAGKGDPVGQALERRGVDPPQPAALPAERDDPLLGDREFLGSAAAGAGRSGQFGLQFYQPLEHPVGARRGERWLFLSLCAGR